MRSSLCMCVSRKLLPHPVCNTVPEKVSLKEQASLGDKRTGVRLTGMLVGLSGEREEGLRYRPNRKSCWEPESRHIL